MSNTTFIKDTIEINNNMTLSIPEPELKDDLLQAVLLPYYMDPDTSEIMVVLKREIMPGAYAIKGKKIGVSALTVDLPKETPLTIEQTFEKINVYLNTKMNNPIPFGSVMPLPKRSNMMYEMVLLHVEPMEMIDYGRGIIYQKKGEFEIGVSAFSDVIEAIENDLLEDMKTRLMLSELYILALQESENNPNPNQMMSGNDEMIGGGNNLSQNSIIDANQTMKTSEIPDEIIQENAKKDYGSIYSRTDINEGFKTIGEDEGDN